RRSPSTYSTAFSSSATTVVTSCTSMSVGIPRAVGLFSSYERPSLTMRSPGSWYSIHDAKYGFEVPSAIRSLKITPVRTSIGSPWQNGVAERWVGSCRRELLDHVIALNERHQNCQASQRSP